RALPAGPDEPPGRRFFLHRQELQAIAAELAIEAGDAALADRWTAAYERWRDWSGRPAGEARARLLHAAPALLRGPQQGATISTRPSGLPGSAPRPTRWRCARSRWPNLPMVLIRRSVASC